MKETIVTDKKRFYAGASKKDITPREPIPIFPFRRKSPFIGVHDELFARAIVISDGIKKCAIIAVDLIAISDDLWRNVTEKIKKKMEIPREYILLCATHTHSGPTIFSFDEIPNEEYDKSYDPKVSDYLEELKSKLVDAVVDADKNLEPAKIGSSEGECLMNINRRLPNAYGRIQFGHNPLKPCDHELAVIRITDEEDNPVAVLFNWPCHASIIGSTNYLLSSDWPGAVARYVERKLDKGIIVAATVGASGDVGPLILGSHVDFSSYGSHILDTFGKILGEEIIRVASSVNSFVFGKIKASQRIVNLPVKKDEVKSNSYLEVRLSVLRIGQIIFAGVSGEVFTKIGIRIKGLSPFRHTYVITHCNGSSGYLVTDSAYEEGGYEVDSTKVESGSEKGLIQLVDMINEL